MTNSNKALVATVKIGNLSLEGLIIIKEVFTLQKLSKYANRLI